MLKVYKKFLHFFVFLSLLAMTSISLYGWEKPNITLTIENTNPEHGIAVSLYHHDDMIFTMVLKPEDIYTLYEINYTDIEIQATSIDIRINRQMLENKSFCVDNPPEKSFCRISYIISPEGIKIIKHTQVPLWLYDAKEVHNNIFKVDSIAKSIPLYYFGLYYTNFHNSNKCLLNIKPQEITTTKVPFYDHSEDFWVINSQIALIFDTSEN